VCQFTVGEKREFDLFQVFQYRFISKYKFFYNTNRYGSFRQKKLNVIVIVFISIIFLSQS